MSTLYINPENTNDIIDKLKNLETHTEVVNLINDIFPTWIIGWPEKYSDDYPQFTKTWEIICKQNNCKPLCIIIVDKIIFNDKDYSLIQLFAEILTVFGHSVKRKEEFINCKFCTKLLPTLNVYNKLQENNIKVPTNWGMKCLNC